MVHKMKGRKVVRLTIFNKGSKTNRMTLLPYFLLYDLFWATVTQDTQWIDFRTILLLKTNIKL